METDDNAWTSEELKYISSKLINVLVKSPKISYDKKIRMKLLDTLDSIEKNHSRIAKLVKMPSKQERNKILLDQRYTAFLKSLGYKKKDKVDSLLANFIKEVLALFDST